MYNAWRQCPRGDWLLWLAARAGIDRKVLVAAACDCVESAMRHVPEGETRPQECLRIVRSWVDGKATIEEVREARRAAAYAADAAYAAYAAYAADARCDQWWIIETLFINRLCQEKKGRGIMHPSLRGVRDYANYNR